MEFALRMNAARHVAHSIDPNDLPINPDSPGYESNFAEGFEPECIEAYRISAPLPRSWSYDCNQTIRCTC